MRTARLTGRLCGRRFGLDERGALRGHIGAHGLIRQASEQLALLDHIPDVDEHFGQFPAR